MDKLESIIEGEKPNLATDDKVALRQAIRRIETSIFSEGSNEQVVEGSSSRKLMILHLIKVGIELQNINLLMILVARLKFSQVALILQSMTHSPDNDKSKLFALSYVAEHFHIEHSSVKEQILTLNHNDCDTIHELISLIKFFIEANEWKKASELSKNFSSRSLNHIICSKLAKQYEAVENFYEALVNYETIETQLDNSVRVIIKQFLGSSRVKLKEYCLTNEQLRDFWDQFALFCAGSSNYRGQEPENLHIESRKKSGLLRTTSNSHLTSLADTLPDRLKNFIDESKNPQKWLNRRTLESIISMSGSLDLAARRLMASQAVQRSTPPPRACALFLCLNEPYVASQVGSRFLSRSDVSRLNFFLNIPEASAADLMRLLRSNGKTITNLRLDFGTNSARKQYIESTFFSALNLGLLDETMRYYSDILLVNEDYAKQILVILENLVATRYSGSFDSLDPTIRAETLVLLRHNLAMERIPLSPLISIIIYCMAIYIHKLDDSVPVPIRVVRKIENMFEHTSDWMKLFSFNATNSLTRSTSLLVTAVKDKLEIVSDSDIIRVGMKTVVEAVASRCLVESQFKQAATLYSQIEDHISAVKSLMRSGDIDTVVNYSLLVRDITVNRLTINYLKHSDVDSKTIENFITKSRE